MRLFDLADVIRSKNAGPYEITFDIIFKDEAMYQKVWAAGVFNKELVSKLYGIEPESIIGILNFNPAKAIKITIARPICSGDLGETDVYGAQQHSPLLNLEFEL